MPKTLARQRRREEHVVQAPIEVRTSPDGKVGIRGYAAVFDAESWGEVIKRGAFKRTLAAGGNVDLLINHDGLPIATTKAGTMTVTVDERGLLVDAPDLDTTNPTVQEVVSAMSRGDVDKMSFAGIFHDAPKIDGLREVREVELWDVSIVTRPWYDETEVGLRSLLQRRSAGELDDNDRRALAQVSLEIGAGYRKLTARAAPAGKTSWGDIIDDIWEAVVSMCDDYVYIADIGDDWVVYACWDDTDALYQSTWSIDTNGVVTVEPGTPVVLTYVPAGDPAAAANDETDLSTMADMPTDRGMSLSLARAYAATGRVPV